MTRWFKPWPYSRSLEVTIPPFDFGSPADCQKNVEFIPIGPMYGIYVSTFTINIKNQLNVGKYTYHSHGSYMGFIFKMFWLSFLARFPFPSHSSQKVFVTLATCVFVWFWKIYIHPWFFSRLEPPKKTRGVIWNVVDGKFASQMLHVTWNFDLHVPNCLSKCR